MGMVNTKSGDPNSNIFATGHTMYINEKGETVTDTFHHVNGETVRQTETGQLPSGGGGFISQSLYTPWVAVVLVASIFLAISTVMFVFTKPKIQRKKAYPDVTVEEKIHSIPLYSLNKPKSPRHASGAKWNIDLLNEVDLEA